MNALLVESFIVLIIAMMKRFEHNSSMEFGNILDNNLVETRDIIIRIAYTTHMTLFHGIYYSTECVFKFPP